MLMLFRDTSHDRQSHFLAQLKRSGFNGALSTARPHKKQVTGVESAQRGSPAILA